MLPVLLAANDMYIVCSVVTRWRTPLGYAEPAWSYLLTSPRVPCPFLYIVCSAYLEKELKHAFVIRPKIFIAHVDAC